MTAAERPLSELALRALLSADKRSLALGRIAIALVLLGDLGRRAASAGFWFAEDGLLPSSLYRGVPHLVSALFVAPGPIAVVLSFVAAAIFDLALLVGYRTRTAQVLAFAALISLESRVPVLQNGGDRMLCIVCFWTMFLPLGDRFSLDARRRGVRSSGNATDPSIAYLAVLLQLAIAYLINSLRKSSVVWEDGTALGYLMRDTTLTSGFGCSVGAHTPASVLWLLTKASRLIEYVAPFLILSPIYTAIARRTAIVLLIGLHVGIAATMNVGAFSFSMMAYFPLLLIDEDWDLLARVSARLRLRLARSPSGKRRLEAWDRFVGAGALPPQVSAARPKRPLRWASEAFVGVFMLGSVDRVLVENGGLAPSAQPEWVKAMLDYPHLYQMWGMFTAEHRSADTVILDAETEDGRHVDPLSDVSTPESREPHPWTRLPACMNVSSFFQDYTFGFARKSRLYQPLEAWVLRYPERTGRPEDRIVRFTLFEASQPIVIDHETAAPLLRRVPLYRYSRASPP